MNRPAPRKSTLTGSPVTPPAPQETAEAAPSTPSTPRRAATKAPRKDAGGTSRVGVYMTPAQFADAKAAYLADWNNGGEADTFSRWVGNAIDTYAARTPKQRSGAQPRGRSDHRTGSTRTFAVPIETVGRMRDAITADQQAGSWLSDSAWSGDAIAYSVEQARARNGGDLPEPPERLTHRLVRSSTTRPS